MHRWPCPQPRLPSVTTGTVVALPDGDEPDSIARRPGLSSGWPMREMKPGPGPEATRAARICAAINEEAPATPITFMAFGAAALLLPPIAMAQRAAHRRVQEYVLVEPEVPPVSEAWPDAPVTVFTDGERPLAALRGWTVLPTADLATWAPSA